jgi:hypothetical protein
MLLLLKHFKEFSFSFFQPIDKQSLLDSGILCCLIHILNALLSTEANQRQKLTNSEGPLPPEKDQDGALEQVRRLEVDFFMC